MIKQSICYPLFRDAAPSPDAFCELVAKIGYRGIDLWGSNHLAELAEPAKANGLTITGFTGHGPIPDGLNNPDNHDHILDTIRRNLDLAAEHGVPTLIAFTGNRLPGQSDFEGVTQAARALRRVAPYAAERGVTITVELLNSKVNHPGYHLDNSDAGFALCEMVDHAAVTLLFDIYHMQIMEGDVIANLTRCMPRIGHIQTAGVPGRHDLDDEQELNYRGIVRAIESLGYTGFVGHEFEAKGDKVKAMEAAYNVCRT